MRGEKDRFILFAQAFVSTSSSQALMSNTFGKGSRSLLCSQAFITCSGT